MLKLVSIFLLNPEIHLKKKVTLRKSKSQGLWSDDATRFTCFLGMHEVPTRLR